MVIVMVIVFRKRYTSPRGGNSENITRLILRNVNDNFFFPNFEEFPLREFEFSNAPTAGVVGGSP